MRYRLDLNYTLMVLPARSPFHKVVSVELLMDVGESLAFVSFKPVFKRTQRHDAVTLPQFLLCSRPPALSLGSASA